MSAMPASRQNGALSSAPAHPIQKRSPSQWIFVPADLLKTPSIVEGLDAATELANRQKGVNFITQVGIMLKLPQLTLSTAAVFLHRYYMRFPMQVNGKGTHHYQIAATALFLATKVEENCRKMKELIVACCRVAQKNPNAAVDEQSKEYWKWRDTILHHEDMLLEALCFDLQLETPYRILFESLCYYGVQDQKNLRNTSWAFLNDSHWTTMCLLHSPKMIAGSALYAGIKLAGITLPDDEDGKPWWEHLGLNILEIQEAWNQMAEVYENPTLPRQGPKDAYTKDDDIMSFERTRRTQSPSIEPSPAYSMRSASQGVKRDREDSWGPDTKNGHSMERDLSQQSLSQQALPSPKKVRVEAAPADGLNDGFQAENAVPNGGTRVPPAASEGAHDVQQRIDDIVNASTTSRVPTSRRPPGANGPVPVYTERVPPAEHSDQMLSPETKHNKTNSGADVVGQNGQTASHTRTEDSPHGQEEVDYGSEEGEV